MYTECLQQGVIVSSPEQEQKSNKNIKLTVHMY